MATELSVPEIGRHIYFLRGQHIMLDAHLAEFYEVSTKRLNEQVKRNIDYFTDEFMFRISAAEYEILKLDFASSSSNHGGRRHLPNAFTMHGATLLANVLSTPRALQVKVAIVRAFGQTRQDSFSEMPSYGKIESQLESVNHTLKDIADAIKDLSASFAAAANARPTQLPIKADQTNFPTPPQSPIAAATMAPTNAPTYAKPIRTYQDTDDPKIEAIKKAVISYFGLRPHDLKSPSREKKIATARQIAMYLIRKHTGAGYHEIGEHFDRKDHTTVMHACRKVEKDLDGNSKICSAVSSIQETTM